MTADKYDSNGLIFKDDGEVIFDIPYMLSEADDKGILIYADQAFLKVGNYNSLQEIAGQPHGMVRHADMPDSTFKDMWSNARGKGFWSGLIKNARKGGGYYWVDTTVLRKVNSKGVITFLFLRRKTTNGAIKKAINLYKIGID